MPSPRRAGGRTVAVHCAPARRDLDLCDGAVVDHPGWRDGELRPQLTVIHHVLTIFLTFLEKISELPPKKSF